MNPKIFSQHSGCEPNWSPVRDKIVFSDHKDYSIYVLDIDSNDTKKVAQGMNPQWSPNGSFIYYQWGTQVGRVKLDDNTNEILYDGDDNIHWVSLSRKGEKIAFTDGLNPGKLYVIDINSSNLMCLMGAESQCDFLGGITWSPDGEWLACQVSQAHSTSNIVLLNVRTLEKKIIFERGYQPAWSPVGNMIVFRARSGNLGSDDIYLYDFITHKFTITGLKQSLIRIEHVRDTFKWSPDGKYTVFERIEAGGRLNYWMKGLSHTICLLRLTDRKIIPLFKGRQDALSSPTWSPDSRKVAMCLHLSDIGFPLCIIDLPE